MIEMGPIFKKITTKKKQRQKKLLMVFYVAMHNSVNITDAIIKYSFSRLYN